MKILLINPSKLDDDGRPIKYRKAFMPPLNLAILKSLTPKDHIVDICNDMTENVDYSGDYDIIGITAMTTQAIRAYQIADEFTKRGKKVILGGPHPTFLPEEAKLHGTIVVSGEADDTWPVIIDDIINKRDKNIYFPEKYPDLQQLQIPDFTGMNFKKYIKFPGYRLPIMPLYTTRGCPNQCTFCSVSNFFGKKYRYKPVENVLKEIDAINAEYYFFVDDNIAVDSAYCTELFHALKSKKIRWMSQISTKVIHTPELIPLAAKSGCDILLTGIESINRQNLFSVNKGFNDPEMYNELFTLMKKSGILPLATVNFGFENDTLETFKDTLECLQKMNVWVFFVILTPLPGSKLYEQMKSENRLLHTNWSHYDLNHVVHEMKNLTTRQLRDNYWDTFQKYYSFKNILKRTFDSIHYPGGNPVITAFENVFYELYFKSIINHFQHPLSGGIGRYSHSI